MGLDTWTIYTQSPYDRSNRPAVTSSSASPRGGSSDGPTLRSSYPAEASKLLGRRLRGEWRHSHTFSKAPGNQVLRGTRRPVLAGVRRHTRASTAQQWGLLPATAGAAVPAHYRPFAGTDPLHYRPRPAWHVPRSTRDHQGGAVYRRGTLRPDRRPCRDAARVPPAHRPHSW